MKLMHDEFKVRTLNREGLVLEQAIAEAFNECLLQLEELCPVYGALDGRAMAIVRTKMEEACFFAKKAMAIRYQCPEV